MDLKDYEQAKFELAATLRSAVLIAREERPEAQQPLDDLLARLAEDRFNLVVVGRFNRGKSSLMNALLQTERLPMGILPLTSVITTVGYGSRERALIERENWHILTEISLDDLPEYVTQQGNPGNRQRVTVARVELPLEILRRGFHLVDTPGLGSSILENTRTTERYLPEADAFMLVTSYDSPLSEEEIRLLGAAASSAREIFVVVNKQDTVPAEHHDAVLAHIRGQLRNLFSEPLPELFSVSALKALQANRHHDSASLEASGVGELRDRLVHFLIEHKQHQFLLRMSERIGAALREVPKAAEAIERLRSFRDRIDATSTTHSAGSVATMAGGMAAFSACEICGRIQAEMYDFLCKYQYDAFARRDVQAKLVERGGLCAFHTWQYEAVASSHGTCVGFAAVLQRLAERLRDISATAASEEICRAIDRLQPGCQSCELCLTHAQLEEAAVMHAAERLRAERPPVATRIPALCLPHLRLLIKAVGDATISRELLAQEADMAERISEDMQRYALKFDGVRRFLASEEETNADRRALMLLAGHPNVNALQKWAEVSNI